MCPAKARTGNEVGRIAKYWGVRRVGTEAQAGLPVLLEKQRRHVGCARCVDGVDVHDARSGTACWEIRFAPAISERDRW